MALFPFLYCTYGLCYGIAGFIELLFKTRLYYVKIYRMKKYRSVSLKSVKTYSLCDRHSKVSLKTFAGVPARGDSLSAFLDKLPEAFAVKDFKAVVSAVVKARKQDRPVVLGMGAHPVNWASHPLL